ncbi:MAG: alpha/beta hydrolase fold domain-containing protein, partial [Pseudorhodoplanes sp.]|nr:alpha/beta hydrolase fold domain-containing protein [Pseudorhodoplanes sp.]
MSAITGGLSAVTAGTARSGRTGTATSDMFAADNTLYIEGSRSPGNERVPSFLANTANVVVRIAGLRRQFAHEDARARHVARGGARTPARPSAAMRRRFDIAVEARHGHEVYTVAPRSGSPGGHVVYLHGGAYVNPISRWHWAFIARLAERLGMTFTVPLYPRAPEHDCAAASAFLLSVYGDLVASRDASDLVVMGDSAGGGLSLSLATQARAAKLPAPAGLVLVSPWLDVAVSDPAQERIERLDPLLMRRGLAAAGRWYAGTMATHDPRVSPIHGDLAGLPPTLLFCGTRDILLSDARRLVA